jgi:hypothetical protein
VTHPRKILHLVVDDKFIDAAIREFEAVAPGRHDFVIVGAHPPFRYLRSPTVRTLSREGWRELVREPGVAAVVLHSLPAAHYPLLADLPPEPLLVWLGWGYDYYGLLADAFAHGLLLPATAALVGRMVRRTPRHAPGLMAASELSVARPYPRPAAAERRLLRRVDVFSALHDEHLLLARHAPWFTPERIEWMYMTLEDDLVVDGAVPADDAARPDILLGNSATPCNNHLEAFELLRERFDLAGRRVVVPLSYGDANYAEQVVQAGRRLLGDAFLPLREFMPRAEYIRLLHGCGTVVMNHVRQQAVGNLLISGLLGARLFVHPASPVLRWLHRRGVHVESNRWLEPGPLPPAQARRNAEAIAAMASRAARRPLTEALVQRAWQPRRAAALAA